MVIRLGTSLTGMKIKAVLVTYAAEKEQRFAAYLDDIVLEV